MAEGFFGRVFGSSKAPAPVPPTPLPPRARQASRVCGGWSDVEVAGESYHRDAIAGLFASWGRPAGGVTMRTAELAPEPGNRYDRDAVRVIVDGKLVGYVPAEDAPAVGREIKRLLPGDVGMTPVRIWATNDDGTWRARVTLAFSGQTEAERDFAGERAAEREVAVRYETSRKVGMVRGQWWGNHRQAIAELKRQNRLDEALALLRECTGAAVRVSTALDEAPDPWPTDQAAVVLRKMKDSAGELRVLEDYATACGSFPLPDKIAERLNRARIAVGPGGAD